MSEQDDFVVFTSEYVTKLQATIADLRAVNLQLSIDNQGRDQFISEQAATIERLNKGQTWLLQEIESLKAKLKGESK